MVAFAIDGEFLIPTRACYYVPHLRALIQAELNARDIPFRSDGECLLIDADYNQFDSVQLSVLGPPPPFGLSIREPVETEAAVEMLRALERSGVSARVMVYAEEEYIVWDEADAVRAEEALGLSPVMREMRQMRDGQWPMPLQ